MQIDRIQLLMDRWGSQGVSALTAIELTELKEEYLRQLGTSTCTTCPSWKDDMFFHFRSYLKTFNRVVMAANHQYIVDPQHGSFYVPGLGLVVNQGGSGEVLTDKLAEDLLKRDPELKEFIIKNPDYVAPSEDAEAKAEAKKETDAQKKADADAKKKADAEAKALADAEAKAKKEAEEAANQTNTEVNA